MDMEKELALQGAFRTEENEQSVRLQLQNFMLTLKCDSKV